MNIVGSYYWRKQQFKVGRLYFIASTNTINNTKSKADRNSKPTNFWTFINGKRNETRIPGTLHLNSEVFKAPTEIVNALADYFKTVYLPKTSRTNMSTDSVIYKDDVGSTISIPYLSQEDSLQAQNAECRSLNWRKV